jgi:transposase
MSDKTGRPTKLQPETHAAIVANLRAGATRKDAAEAAGVSYHSLLNWMDRGENATRGAFCDFFKAARQAEAEARVAMTRIITDAAEKDWRAALEYLKRRDRPSWGDAQVVDLDVKSEPEQVVFDYSRFIRTAIGPGENNDG